MARTGRPTVLNVEMKDAIVDLLKRGNYITTSATAVGIRPGTIGVWIKKGEELSQLDRDLDETEQLFVDFSLEVQKARAFAEVAHVENIRQASKENWTASAWWLERTNPRDWGKVQRTEITGADGGAIQVDIESVNRKIEAMLANRIIDAEIAEEARALDEASQEGDLLSDLRAEMEARVEGNSPN